MSPARLRQEAAQAGFPRVSGDEPAVSGGTADTYKFSPRERG